MALPTTPEAIQAAAEAFRKSLTDMSAGNWFNEPFFGPGGRYERMGKGPLLPFFVWKLPRRRDPVSPDMVQMIDDIERNK